MIRFFLAWLRQAIHYPDEQIKIKLHLYKDMNVGVETKYWKTITGLGNDHFAKPYIKETTLRGLTYKTRGHGTCNVIAGRLKYARPVFAGMEVVARMF